MWLSQIFLFDILKLYYICIMEYRINSYKRHSYTIHAVRWDFSNTSEVMNLVQPFGYTVEKVTVESTNTSEHYLEIRNHRTNRTQTVLSGEWVVLEGNTVLVYSNEEFNGVGELYMGDCSITTGNSTSVLHTDGSGATTTRLHNPLITQDSYMTDAPKMTYPEGPVELPPTEAEIAWEEAIKVFSYLTSHNLQDGIPVIINHLEYLRGKHNIPQFNSAEGFKKYWQLRRGNLI